MDVTVQYSIPSRKIDLAKECFDVEGQKFSINLNIHTTRLPLLGL